MTSNQATPSKTVLTITPYVTKELRFAGDGVLLAGQIDYPDLPRPAGGFPLVFILPHAGCNTRDCYEHYVEVALANGYAIFRWDKRGTGRSGAGGRGSTTQDAVAAYEVALDQPNIDPHGVVILAQGAGTGMLGTSYGLFARVQAPHGVVLVSNLLDESAILAIDAPLQIIQGEDDWNDWSVYAEAATAAHNRAYRWGATYTMIPHADRMLADLSDERQAFHPGARKVLQTWLRQMHPGLPLI